MAVRLLAIVTPRNRDGYAILTGEVVKKIKRCPVCNNIIPQEMHVIARSRKPIDQRDPDGLDAIYDSTKCRVTAAKRRERAGEQVPRETFIKQIRKKKP